MTKKYNSIPIYLSCGIPAIAILFVLIYVVKFFPQNGTEPISSVKTVKPEPLHFLYSVGANLQQAKDILKLYGYRVNDRNPNGFMILIPKSNAQKWMQNFFPDFVEDALLPEYSPKELELSVYSDGNIFFFVVSYGDKSVILDLNNPDVQKFLGNELPAGVFESLNQARKDFNTNK